MMNLLELENVSFSYSKSNPNGFSLNNISLDIPGGEFISVIGKNGSGKSTLVKLISGVYVGYQGKILYKNKNTLSIEKKEFSRNVSYLPQAATALNEDLLVKDFLLLGRYAHKKFTDFRFSKEDNDIVENCMNETSVKEFANKSLSDLSGGEKQKVLLTMGLVQLDITKSLEGKILIVDEPLTYLDINHQFEIFSILKKLQSKLLTIIIVIHDLNFALRFSDRTILMNNGNLIGYSSSKNIITEEMLKEHFQVDSNILESEKYYHINYLTN